jgi:hypothetical protein
MSRVLLLDADAVHDVFELVELADAVVRVRTPYLFEVGEELQLRVERGDGPAADAVARVRKHTGDGADKVTELELLGGGTASGKDDR